MAYNVSDKTSGTGLISGARKKVAQMENQTLEQQAKLYQPPKKVTPTIKPKSNVLRTIGEGVEKVKPIAKAVSEVSKKTSPDAYAEQIKKEFGYDPRKPIESMKFGTFDRWGLSKEEKNRLGELESKYTFSKQAEDNRFALGMSDALSLGYSTKAIEQGVPEEIKPKYEKAKDTGLFKAGKVAGDIVKYGALYSAAGPLISGATIPTAGGVGAATGTLLPTVGQSLGYTLGSGALGAATGELIKDVTLGAGLGAVEAKARGEDVAKTVAENILMDIGFNVGGAALGQGFKFAKNYIDKAKASKTPEVIEKVSKSMNVSPQEASKQIDNQIDVYVNQYGVADTKPFEQLQLPAPKQGYVSDSMSNKLRSVDESKYKGADYKGKYSLTERKYPTTDIGNRKVNAFQYDNQEVQPYYKEKASELLDDITYSKKGGHTGGKILKNEFGDVVGREGNFRVTTPQAARILDETGYGYEDIKKALKGIIEDNGKENNALSKKIEPIIDDMLVDGYTNVVGETVNPNIRYIQTRNRLDPTKIPIPELEGAKASQLNQQIKMGIDEQKSMFDFDHEDDWLNLGIKSSKQETDPIKQQIKQKIVNRPSEFAIQKPQYPQLQKDFKTERPFTVMPNQSSNPIKSVRNKLAQEQPIVENIAEKYDPEFARMDIKPDYTTSKKNVQKPVEPIDTLSKIMVDMPKKTKPSLGQNLERIYQETVSKNVPFENLSRKTDSDLLRASSSNLNRTTGTVDYNISKTQSDMDGNSIGDSIQGIFKDVDEGTKPQFFDYVLNKHNIERYEQGKPVFGDSVTSDTSMNKVIEYEANNPKFAEQQQKVTKYFNNLMNDWAVKSGLVSEETASMLKEMYPNYVPTYRASEIERAMGSGDGNFVSQILKKAKGSEKNILPLDQQMAILTDRTIRNARKNEVMTMLDDVYQSNPEIASKYVYDVKKVGEKPKVDDLLDVGKELEQPVTKSGDKYTVKFYRNGEPYQMTINKTLYESLATIEKDGLDKGLDVIKKYATNPFKSLITQKNPIFFVRNVMRDIPTALIYSNDSLGLVKNTPEALKEMLTNGKLWNQYQAMGGTRSGLFNYEKGVKIDFEGTKKSIPKKISEKTGNALEMANNMTETLPRFVEYVTSIKKGEPPMVALMRAAEITTDFSRFGKQTKRADAVVPYLNASIQGLDKFGRQLRDKPLQTMAKGGLVVSIPALILDQVNKNNKDYNEMTSHERNNYYHIPKEDGTFYRIPRSREVGVMFGTALEWISRKARGQEVTGDEIKETLKSNFTPVNGFDSNIIKPALSFIDIATGKNTDAKNYFGSNIVPQSLQRYSPGKQFTESTTSISKALGEYLDIPPVAIDYLLDSYLGVVADIGMPLLTDNKKKALSPFTNAFIADPVLKSASVDKLYSNINKYDTLAADANKKYDFDSKLITPYESYRNSLTKTSRQLSELRTKQKEAQAKNNEVLVRDLFTLLR